MGSLRNPIGPLPSSIYWRRRAVALAVLALLVLLVVWMIVSGGGGTSDEDKGGGGNGPASTITPGPTSSGPVHSDRPGGRDEEDGDGGSGGSGGSEGSGGEDGGSGESGGSGDEAGGGAAGGSGWGTGGGSAAGGGSGAGGGGGSSAGKGAGAALPADSKLPGCGDGDVKLSLRPVEKKYPAGEKPRFRLTVENDKGSACKVDLGRESTVVTIKDADDAKVWTSDDCLRNKEPFLRQVPANGDSVHTLTWFGKPSAANCASPPADSAKPGEYEIEVKVKGLKAARTSFELI